MLDHSWVLCLPSRSEGLGRIVLEAMAAGRAVIATRGGGPEELVIDHQSGRLVTVEDPHELVSALVDVLGNRSLAEAMGAEGRRLAELVTPWPSTRPGSKDCHAGSSGGDVAPDHRQGGETAPDTANRDVARAQQLARRIDDLVVLEADETWWTPVRAHQADIAWRPEPIDSDPDARRSSLALVMRETAERESGAVVLLLDADPQLVKQLILSPRGWTSHCSGGTRDRRPKRWWQRFAHTSPVCSLRGPTRPRSPVGSGVSTRGSTSRSSSRSKGFPSAPHCGCWSGRRLENRT